ncbi:MAG: putative ATP-dependent endonuclease of OLD family [Psychroserpens sp.]|jgi:predicted ATP-dependent endonuclease of OLD family
MQLESFRVRNFRSINDSGVITTEQLTAILGRNESGKSNLLLALQTLNPPEGSKDIIAIKDFPRDRRLDDATNETPLLDTYWKLEDDEKAELVKILPRAASVSSIKISRNYIKTNYYALVGLKPHDFNSASTRQKIKKISTKIVVEFDKLNLPESEQLTIIQKDLLVITPNDDVSAEEWFPEVKDVMANIRKILATQNIDNDGIDTLIDDIEVLAESLDDKNNRQEAIKWISERLPIFIYVDDYPDLNGHHDLGEYNTRVTRNTPAKEDENFDKLCKVAGIDPMQLIKLSNDPETRNQLVNRAGAIVTKEIRRLWKDRVLKVRFNIDSNHFDTYISDPNSTYDVEVNLNERSRGFKWFFSFYITFFADTQNGKADNAIILLDEPGLYLHAKSQTDLLKHLDEDFSNQIIYTTHSPFLVPTKKITTVKTVSIDEVKGTTVTNDPTGDSTTLFPLQAALGYDIAQSLFIGSNNLIVEGITDFWYLNSISDYLKTIDREGLDPKIIITPAGGAQKISYMVSLLSSQNLNVVVLLDEERESKATRDDLVSGHIIHKNNILFVSECLNEDVTEADIEDLLNRDIFLNLVKSTYSDDLVFNEKIPRVAKQAEGALRASNKKLTFVKAKPAREFMKLLGSNPESVMDDKSINNFENLFRSINSKIKNASRNLI